MPKTINLSERFQPEKYELDSSGGLARILGKKIGPPSNRIALHQKGLKVSDAQIIRHDKRGDQQFMPTRINHLPTFEQVRLHTKETLFPGYYEIVIHFSPRPGLASKLPKRELFPCIDEPDAWANAEVVSRE